MRTIVATLVAWLAFSAVARAQPSCGEPPRVDDQTLKGEVEGKAKFLSSLVGDANLKGQIETARTDIFSKYPNAGSTRSDAYLEYVFCSFVLSDPKWTAEAKFRAILEFRQVAAQPAQPSGQTTITAPGGVAAGTIDRSPITISPSPSTSPK
jgi:hypothetical protein